MTSYKTTILGVLTILGAVITAAVQFMNGGATAVNWEVAVFGVTSGFGLIAARDNDKSSQDVGIRPITGRR